MITAADVLEAHQRGYPLDPDLVRRSAAQLGRPAPRVAPLPAELAAYLGHLAAGLGHMPAALDPTVDIHPTWSGSGPRRARRRA